MKKSKRSFPEIIKSLFKNKIFLICAAVVLVAAIAVLVICLVTGNGANGNSATEDEAATSFVVEDENAYIFAQGIFIGSADIGNVSYAQAREIAQKEAEKLIKDFTLTVNASDKSYTYTKADFTFENNIETLLQDAAGYSNSLTDKSNTEAKVFDIEFWVSQASVEAKVQEIAKEVDIEPVNATIGEGQGDVGVTKSAAGFKVNQKNLTDSMVKEINSMAKGEKDKAAVKAKIDEIQPTLTYDDLNGKITLLSSFKTVSTNTADGNHNMALALEACNGSIIGPGEVWSFNDCTGNSNLTSLGYRPATVIVGGEFVSGIGGGLCQSSTTIYNAAIRTNMEIVERYCHYFQSSYADAGLDATIDWPNLDLKLKNPTEYPMYIQCYMSGTTLYCNIYGYQDPSFDEVQIDSYIYDANRAQNYYKAGATRTFLKNGKVVLEEQLPYSTYHYVSPKDETSEPTESTAPATKPQGTTAPATKPTSGTTPAPTKPVTPTLPADPTEPVTQPDTAPFEY